MVMVRAEESTPPLVTHYRRGWWREPCVYCGERRAKSQMTKEHIVPVSAGGSSSWENIATACHNCNHKRGAMPLILMLLWQSFERQGIRLTKAKRKVMGIVQPMQELTTDPEPVILES